MKKRVQIFILSLFFIFSILSFASCVKPTTIPDYPLGYKIVEQQIEYLESETTYQYHFFVTNTSTGKVYGPPTVSCKFFLADTNGTVTQIINPTYSQVFWTVILNKSYIDNGEHPYGLYCNNTNFGGTLSGTFFANPSGVEFTIGRALLFFLVFLLIVFFLFFSITGIRTSTSGAWFVFYTCITYIATYTLIGLGYLISIKYLWDSPIVGNILYIIWLVLGVGFLPFVIGVSLYILGNEAKSVLEEGYMKEGYTKDEAKELSRKK